MSESPLSLGTADHLAAGFVISHYKERVLRPLIWVGYALGAIGFALWYRFFGYGASAAAYEGLQVVAAVGIGLSMQPPLIACQAAMPLREVASVTAVFSIARPIGASLGEPFVLQPPGRPAEGLA